MLMKMRLFFNPVTLKQLPVVFHVFLPERLFLSFAVFCPVL